jgi:hypothetical protein
MNVIRKDKLAERVKMHLAAQTPSGDGEKDYDASGQVDAEKADPMVEIENHMSALAAAIKKHLSPEV